jgi:hypothetical protein
VKKKYAGYLSQAGTYEIEFDEFHDEIRAKYWGGYSEGMGTPPLYLIRVSGPCRLEGTSIQDLRVIPHTGPVEWAVTEHKEHIAAHLGLMKDRLLDAIEAGAVPVEVLQQLLDPENGFNLTAQQARQLIEAPDLPCEKRCECGSEAVGYTTHSSWCPKDQRVGS